MASGWQRIGQSWPWVKWALLSERKCRHWFDPTVEGWWKVLGETVAEWVGGTTPGLAGQLRVSSWQTEVGGKPCFDPPSPCLLVPILMFDCSAFSLLWPIFSAQLTLACAIPSFWCSNCHLQVVWYNAAISNFLFDWFCLSLSPVGWVLTLKTVYQIWC